MRSFPLAWAALWTYRALGTLLEIWQLGGAALSLSVALLWGLVTWLLVRMLLARFDRTLTSTILYGIALLIFIPMILLRLDTASTDVMVIPGYFMLIVAELIGLGDGPKKWMKKQLAALKPRLPRFARPVMGVPA